MNRVRFLLVLIASPFFLNATIFGQTPDKEDQEALAAYQELFALAKIGGYNGHKDAQGKSIDGLKSMQFVTSFDEKDPRLTEARLKNIASAAEFVYELVRQPKLTGQLVYGQPEITLREPSGIEITASVSAPKELMRPNVVKWVWRLRKGFDGWRIFAAYVDLSPHYESRLRPGLESVMIDKDETRISKKLCFWCRR